MRFVVVLLLILLLSFPCFAYRSLEFGKQIRSVSFLVLPGYKFKNQTWEFSYEKDEVEAYLANHSISDLYLFGVNKKEKANDWLTWLVGINGQKTNNTLPITLGIGAIAGSKFGELAYSSSFLTSYYGNSAGTVEYEFHLDFRKVVLGMRGLLWFVSGEGSLNELYWIIGYKLRI
ncbi:MAG: hypothetical protein KJ732_07380 [Candidatus Margulisbacteria bacterium]|nr:hypothetical protein [Candidatus Margulisiibacteriota bacterium]